MICYANVYKGRPISRAESLARFGMARREEAGAAVHGQIQMSYVDSEKPLKVSHLKRDRGDGNKRAMIENGKSSAAIHFIVDISSQRFLC